MHCMCVGGAVVRWWAVLSIRTLPFRLFQTLSSFNNTDPFSFDTLHHPSPQQTIHPPTLPPPQAIIMFGFGEGQQQYDQVYNQDQGDQDQDQNQGKFSHELIAGGASFAAMKVFEDRQRAEGMLHFILCKSFLTAMD